VRILVDYRPALRQRTGVGEYVHETARALVASSPPQESLTLFSSSWKDRLPADAIPGAQQVDRRLPVRLLNLAWHRLGWPPVERLTGQTFDIVQSSHPLLVPASPRAARLVTIYDLDFLDHPERTTREIRRDYPALAGSHARQADQVIVISSHTAESVVTRLGVPASRVSICRPGAPAWPARESEPASGGTILFLGSIEPRKNLNVLLDAYERLLSTPAVLPRLVLAGGLSEQSAPILDRLKRPPLAGRVDVPGYVSATNRQALYRQALVFVMPSHTEGFGMPVIEAMVIGVPVIAADRGALPEAAGDAGILVPAGDSLVLAQELSLLLGDATRRRAMTDRGWEHARHFTWARTADQTRQAWAHATSHARMRRG